MNVREIWHHPLDSNRPATESSYENQECNCCCLSQPIKRQRYNPQVALELFFVKSESRALHKNGLRISEKVVFFISVIPVFELFFKF